MSHVAKAFLGLFGVMLILAWAASLNSKLSPLYNLAIILGVGAIIALFSKGTNLQL